MFVFEKVPYFLPLRIVAILVQFVSATLRGKKAFVSVPLEFESVMVWCSLLLLEYWKHSHFKKNWMESLVFGNLVFTLEF